MKEFVHQKKTETGIVKKVIYIKMIWKRIDKR